MINACNAVYKNGYNELQLEDYEKGLNNSTIKRFEEDWIAGSWKNWVEELLENNNQKIEVLCFNLIDEYEELIRENRFLEASQLLIQAYRYEVEITKERKFGDTLIAINIEYDVSIGYFKNEDDVENQFL